MEGNPEKPDERAPEYRSYFRADQGLSGFSNLLVFLSCSGHCPGRGTSLAFFGIVVSP